MSGSNSFQRGEEPPAGLSINLSSNNPFRNRAASPSSPFDDPPPRPVSRNPFIDQPPAPGTMSSKADHKSLSAEEIFNSLTLDDKKSDAPSKSGPLPSQQRPRGENVPPGLQSNRHRPTPSQEEALRARKMQAIGQRPGPAGSPPKRPQQRRPRRNSDSSAIDLDSMPLTEEEKRMIARRRERERQRRERGTSDGQEKVDKIEKADTGDKTEARGESREGRNRSKAGRSSRPSRRMDIIDQLDATSIYGTGLFHHDGPFDALNPHRNRNSSRRAPMQAFPKDSLNNSIAGGPLNKVPDHSTFMGQNNDEAFKDYSTGARPKPGEAPIFDPIARGNVIHGDESVGLGTSTFLEGTPAARTAIARHRQEQAQAFEDGGLQRKKSLAQRIRHINKGPRDYPSGRMTNPEAALNNRQSPGVAEGEPFFSEYSKGEDSISVRPREGAMSPTSPPPHARRGSSGAVLERRATTDATAASEEGLKSSGILGRMKSLKGGRKARNPDGAMSPPDNSGSLI